MRNPWLVVLVSALGLGLLYGRAVYNRPAPQTAELAAVPPLLEAGRAVVRVAVADLFVRPAEGGAVGDQARLGEWVTVRAAVKDAPLVEVRTAAGYPGFMRARELTPLPPGAPTYTSTGRFVEVSARFANIYAQPDVTLQNPLLVAPLGVHVQLEAELDDRWLAVLLPDGRRGFVQRGDVTLDPRPRFSSSCVLEQARRHAGTPYLWGGRSTFGVDCSGLVANAFQACGMISPRDADQQHDWADLRDVPPGAEQPGDLIFFGRADAKKKVTHVGLVLPGGRFVHASTSVRPQVQESALLDPAWQAQRVGVRRHPSMLQDTTGP